MSQSTFNNDTFIRKTHNISRCMFAGYVTNSGTYFDLFIPVTKVSSDASLAIDTSSDIEGVCFFNDSYLSFGKNDVFDFSQTIFAKRDLGINVSLKFKNAQSNTTKPGVIYFTKGGLIVS